MVHTLRWWHFTCIRYSK